MIIISVEAHANVNALHKIALNTNSGILQIVNVVAILLSAVSTNILITNHAHADALVKFAQKIIFSTMNNASAIALNLRLIQLI
jgi:hypothetical protein